MVNMESYSSCCIQKANLSYRRVRLSWLQLLFVGLMVAVSIFNNTRGKVAWLGYTSIFMLLLVTLLLLLAMHLKGRGLRKKLYPTVVIGTLLSGVYVVAAVMGGFALRSIVVVGQLVALMCFLLTMASFTWDKRNIQRLAYFFVPVIVCLSVFAQSLPINENVIGSFLVFLLFWPIAARLLAERQLDKLLWTTISVVGFLGMIHSGARSTWFAFGGAFLTYMLYDIIIRRKIVYIGYFFGVAAVVVFVTVIYPQLFDTPLAAVLQEYSLRLTGRNFFSGRQYLWPVILDAIKQRPWLGYGASATPALIMDTSLSSHNLFLQISLQVGLVGMTIFGVFLLSIWNCFWYGRDNRIVRLSTAFFVAVMLHQLFEVSLTQNNLAVGILQWFGLSVGLSYSLENDMVD